MPSFATSGTLSRSAAEQNVMGYFGELAGVNFKKDVEGRDLFFPFGIWGKGRILPDSETAARLRSSGALVIELTMFAAMACFAWTFIAISGFQLPIVYVAYPWAALIAGSLMASIGLWFHNFKVTRGMAISDERLTYAETRLAARQCNLATRRSQRKVMLAWMTVTFAGVCIPWWLGMGPLGLDGRGFAPSGFFFVAAIICLAILVWMIAADRRQSSRP
jgi:hypothetical protein